MIPAVEALERLRQGNRRFMEQDGLPVVGAEYSLESGAVDFFDPAPTS